jgi:N-acetylneuraminic acid mutarotase
LGSDIYVFGGYDNEGTNHASIFNYDTVANTWTTLAPMPTSGVYPGVATLDGRIYVTGMGDSGKEFLFFDLTSGAWSNLARTRHNRQQGSLFVLGGCLHAAGGHGNHKTVERYDVATDAWTAAADMLEGRRLFGAVTIPAAGPAEEQNLFDALIAKATR